MSLVLLESRTAASGFYPIWSGLPPLLPQLSKIYADTLDTYIEGPYKPLDASSWLLRVNTREPAYLAEETHPPAAANSMGLLAVHYWGEGGYAVYTAAVAVSGNKNLFASNYPEYQYQWTDCGGPNTASGNAVDIVFPDTPNSPRFLIGIDGADSEHVLVVLADSPGLINRYPTNWTAMSGIGSVTDLECVRFI